MPRIKIEDKHTYFNYNAALFGNNRFTTLSAPVDNFITHEPYWPVAGTDENNRIGRKIQSMSIHHEGYVALPLESAEGTTPVLSRLTILDGWNGYQQDLINRLTPDNYEFPSGKTMFSIPIRHLWIEFYDEDFEDGTTADRAVYLQNWFKNLTVQIGATSTDDYPSVQTKMLRESTPYTGEFKILKDTIYWLSPDKPIVHFNEEIPYRRSLSFDAQGSQRPTNAHIYSLWIAPTQPKYDYFNYGFGYWMNSQALNPEAPYYVAGIQGNIKLNYIDI